MVKIIEYLKSIVMPHRKTHNFEEFLLFVKQSKEIVILTSIQCVFIAELLSSALAKMNIATNIIFKKPKWGYSNLPHIVICPQIFKYLPVNYIAFQMEQSESSKWFTDDYFKKLNQAIAIFDYSSQNVEYLRKHIQNSSKIFYLPLSINKEYLSKYNSMKSNRAYDVFFYGDDSSERRKKILGVLKSKYNLRIVKGKFGDDIYNELSNSKIIVNIHYYENALLETTRIYECLSLNNNVIISERGRDQDQHTFLEEYVDFIDDGDVDELVKKIDYYLSDYNLLNDKINKNQNSLLQIDVTEFEKTLKYILRDLVTA